MRPFKPPSFKRNNEPTTDGASMYVPAGTTKRRKLSPEPEERPAKPGKFRQPGRNALRDVYNESSPEEPAATAKSTSTKTYYRILWRRPTNKKNKTWDDDGVLSYGDGMATLYDNKGRRLGGSSRDNIPSAGVVFSLAGREVEVEDEITRTEFANVVKISDALPPGALADRDSKSKLRVPDIPTEKPKAMSLQEQMRLQISSSKPNKEQKSLPAQRTQMQSAFKQPLKENNVLPQVPSEVPIPRHDPTTPDALVFKRPAKAPPGKQIVDVVLDPKLSKKLRDHQREGVKFLYECVMGLRDFGGQGCILADEMGLGKTLQTISLIWTLLKQNPTHKAEPIIKKVLIVCPVTLVKNWQKEFRKWLGPQSPGIMTFEDQKYGARLSMFDGRNYNVLIVGYERLQKIAEDLTRGSGIDLVICDEGHRLKTLKSKSVQAIETLNTPRRIILSGTPIQNDLNEFFAMVNFVNDGVLGSMKAFAKSFEKPIMKSRQPDASPADVEAGQEASDELAATTSPFILRRTADILSHYLPPKTEYVLFCPPTREQASIYREVLRTPMFQDALGSSEVAFQMITLLKKLCNSPALLRPTQGTDNATSSTTLETLNEMLPKGIPRLFQNSLSSKIRLLDSLLQRIHRTTDDKIVLVSNYTSTLDLIENLLSTSALPFRRLDGSVPPTKRQAMVDEFNRTSASACFAFLLSAKAGGVGLNLIGANRLILFDIDWNPAIDDQAMARIHRDGQKKPCSIYRFLIKGSLEERIWQRQVVKRGLADSIMDGGGSGTAAASAGPGKKGKAAFSREELKDLFTLDERDGLQTHDLIGCSCKGRIDRTSSLTTTPQVGTPAAVTDIDDLEPEFEPDAELTRKSISSSPTKQLGIIPASQLPTEDDEQAASTLNDGRDMQELMAYAHINTSASALGALLLTTPKTRSSNVDAETELDDDSHEESEEHQALASAIDDACLTHLLTHARSDGMAGVDYVFMKRTKNSLEEAEADGGGDIK